MVTRPQETFPLWTKNVWALVGLFSFCSLTAWAIEPANPNLCAKGREILQYFQSVYGKRLLAGYNVYVHTPDDYEQTGMLAAIWGRDMQWLPPVDEVIEHARAHGYILTIHWHWFFGGDSAWKSQRKSQVDVGRVVTPGTPEHEIAMREMAAAADVLHKLQDAGIVVLWRPLHEIDGGWFWWTDLDRPENTAELWRMMFRYFTKERKLNNLIWVYSAGVGDLKRKPVEYRRRFYPGPEFVDISGIDLYGVNPAVDEEPYWTFFKAMAEVSPGKMLALGECDEIPNPEKLAAGRTPLWLYAMPWWGTPSGRRPVGQAITFMRHPLVVTLDELPAFAGEDPPPVVGILSPMDDGSAWYPAGEVIVEGYAVDRRGKVARLEFWAGDERVDVMLDPPQKFRWVWRNPRPGCYDLRAVAVDDAGQQMRSNRIHLAVGVVDAARGKKVQVSAGENPAAATDGNYYTSWFAPREAEQAWIAVDLGKIQRISQVNLVWGWKIHPEHFAVEVSSKPEPSPDDWRRVYEVKGLPWQTWKATHRVQFEPVEARHIRVQLFRRANEQTWGGYDLVALEVPVAP
ncbi:MAG: glycosyl hydrolase [Thermoguttaceae bacterium]|nr:glycosyl hydrolase [Thermoguttaceae bacterium]MDW8077857.1 glycosyl hydrolase [Thermoguttaceae bacterium]